MAKKSSKGPEPHLFAHMDNPEQAAERKRRNMKSMRLVFGEKFGTTRKGRAEKAEEEFQEKRFSQQVFLDRLRVKELRDNPPKPPRTANEREEADMRELAQRRYLQRGGWSSISLKRAGETGRRRGE
jgi:hypothetical protein